MANEFSSAKCITEIMVASHGVSCVFEEYFNLGMSPYSKTPFGICEPQRGGVAARSTMFLFSLFKSLVRPFDPFNNI